MIDSKLIASLVIAATVAVVGCSSKSAKDGTGRGPSSSSSGLNTYGSGDGSTSGGMDAAGLAANHSVYFDFDSAEIKPEGQSVISSWAKYLTSHPTSKVRLEGNTDERGTREYNIALGERRGNTVAQALESSGVSASQVSVTSYGEERPVALGHDESSWSQNRRVDLIQQ